MESGSKTTTDRLTGSSNSSISNHDECRSDESTDQGRKKQDFDWTKVGKVDFGRTSMMWYSEKLVVLRFKVISLLIVRSIVSPSRREDAGRRVEKKIHLPFVIATFFEKWIFK